MLVRKRQNGQKKEEQRSSLLLFLFDGRADFDIVAVGVGDVGDGLAPGFDGGFFDDGDACGTEFFDELRDVGDDEAQFEGLGVQGGFGHLQADEFLDAFLGVEGEDRRPGVELDVGAVFCAHGQAEQVAVEVQGALVVGYVQDDVT